MEKLHVIIGSAILALGVALGGLCISKGLYHYADKDRSVTVKGLSTRDVMADHAIWPLSYSVQGNELISLYDDLRNLQNIVESFMIEQGFTKDEIQFANVDVTNNWTNYYSDRRPDYRYTLSSKIVINTDNVELVQKSQGCQSKLLSRGIILNSDDWQLDYQYNGLAELKPSMIEEATKNARSVAQKFADDANCKLGSIRRANQGQFSIEPDEYCPWIKHVRVVTTVDYYLN